MPGSPFCFGEWGSVVYTVFLAGGIASGKSSVARRLVERGAWRCDLDAISREVLEPGSPVLDDVAEAFGEDLVDPVTGELNRAELARRAFATREDAARLEAIELPAIADRLADALARAQEGCCGESPRVAVVEIPLLDRMGERIDLADEVLVVSCPVDVRRRRAIGRGMTADDFDARAANQPSDGYLAAHANTVIDNAGDETSLLAAVDAWWDEHEGRGWRVSGRG